MEDINSAIFISLILSLIIVSITEARQKNVFIQTIVAYNRALESTPLIDLQGLYIPISNNFKFYNLKEEEFVFGKHENAHYIKYVKEYFYKKKMLGYAKALLIALFAIGLYLSGEKYLNFSNDEILD